MALLDVRVFPSDNLERFELRIDGEFVWFSPENKGEIEIARDVAQHRIHVAYFGESGAKLSYKIYSEGRLVLEDDGEIEPQSVPYGTSSAHFTL